MIRTVIITIIGLVLALVIVVGVNTASVGPPPLGEVPPADAVRVDAEAAAARLAGAIRLRTVSRDPSPPAAGAAHGNLVRNECSTEGAPLGEAARGAAVEGAAFRALHAYLADSFPAVHARLDRETVSEYSLLYTWEGSDPAAKPILLLAHMDVVPIEPGTEGKWTHPAFGGDIAEGFVWGRGTLDDKSSVVGILEAVELLLGEGFTPARTVYLAFGHDEELDGPNGAAKIVDLLEGRGVRLDFSLDEGGVIAHDIVPGVAPPVALLGVAEKGYLALNLCATGEGGHSALPPPQPQRMAIAKIGRAVHRLDANRMPAALVPPVTDMFDYLAPEMPLTVRVPLANRWLFEPLLLAQLERAKATNASIRSTTALTKLAAGVKANVLPTRAEAVADFRIMPGESVADVVAHVTATIDDPEVTVRQLGPANEPTPVSDLDSESFALLRRTVRQVFPDAVAAPSLVIAGTDSKHTARIADNTYRFLPIRLGPDDLDRLHGTNERIAIENYAEIIRFYVQFLRNAAGG